MRENYTTVLNDIEGRAKIIDLNKIEINKYTLFMDIRTQNYNNINAV